MPIKYVTFIVLAMVLGMIIGGIVFRGYNEPSVRLCKLETVRYVDADNVVYDSDSTMVVDDESYNTNNYTIMP
jgi:hypothetical protein